jgi:hypothetical protein
MPQVPITTSTIVVRVDEILHAPEVLAGLTGKEITVQLPEGEQAEVGAQMVFDTTGWLYGNSIAVRSVGQRPAAGRDPVQALADRDLQEHVVDADLVVSGEVTSVSLPATPPAETAAAAAPLRKLTEHDPNFHVANVRIESVEKGHYPQQEVQVAFPASTDVAWYRAPKFKPGQQGVFLLHSTEPAGEAGGAEVAGPTEPSAPAPYMVLDDLDFQPREKTGQVRNFIGGIAPSGQTGSASEH